MKYLTLLVLIINTFSLVKGTIFSQVLYDDFVIDKTTLDGSLSPECIEEEKKSEYNECLPEMTLNNYNETCISVYSEKCQKFYKDTDKSKYFPICSKNPLYNEYLQPNIVEYIRLILMSQCFSDEKNYLCPYSVYAITNLNSEDILIENCKSKQCTDSLKNIYRDIKYEYLEAINTLKTLEVKVRKYQIDGMNLVKMILESDKCKSLHVSVDTSSNSSDAINIKINNIILVFSLSILLIFFH